MSGKSDLWNHFIKKGLGGTCKYCQQEVKTKRNTTNLRNHLLRRHPSIHTTSLKKKSESGGSKFVPEGHGAALRILEKTLFAVWNIEILDGSLNWIQQFASFSDQVLEKKNFLPEKCSNTLKTSESTGRWEGALLMPSQERKYTEKTMPFYPPTLVESAPVKMK
ncbi:hypothetical protein WA026_004201 [Henosepilachna vigintioctopunctata]|uniref:BED-type domain-containing protein n=1 Tax=Henosepilachna vigintioctopunctata TaxID=420089 RepID=A0AAW1UFP6_9CUCU